MEAILLNEAKYAVIIVIITRTIHAVIYWLSGKQARTQVEVDRFLIKVTIKTKTRFKNRVQVQGKVR